ncbi:phage portal protein [Paenibacillus hemerocallicola]|uniref:Phage portal protein n=1 Tax=Paenibacillus hemerocallicola TaxID=1172614 RepID=A0A5C4T9U7_9BACL|nr:phage portal protein [Paenibacillus hemerocallicola]TNJ65169.1 phage portal protein [Paenibacillus hemerocallicola]
MSVPEYRAYEVVLDNSYLLGDLIESITLEESLDEIAYRATVSLMKPSGFPDIRPGQEIRVSGVPHRGSDLVYLLNPGVVWECEHSYRGADRLTLTVYDRTIYMAKSEDEYVFPAGQTASQRLKQYAADWDISLWQIPDTVYTLSKKVYRSQPIYSMLLADLKETARKGGWLYRPRMTPNGLELFPLGSNETVWALEPGGNVESITQRRTLEGTVTKVKVLGKEDNPESATPVLAVESKETELYGTLQKVVMDNDINTVSEAVTAAKGFLSGIQETLSVSAVDVNTIRAGDKVELAGSGMELIATSVRHELGRPGKMTLELATYEYVKRRYFLDGSV